MRTRARAENPPTAAGAVAVPPRMKKKELTGGVSPSASRRERGKEGLTSGTRPSVTA